MRLNKQKGNMYNFITHTGNTIKGKCPHGCTYCYVSRFGPLGTPRLDLSEFRTSLPEGLFIFWGSSFDCFAYSVATSWITRSLEYLYHFNNRYFFQSKNPDRFFEYFDYFHEMKDPILCTTIESNREYPNIYKNSPSIETRASAMHELSTKFETMVTIEPILDFDLPSLVDLIAFSGCSQVNIGADSKRCSLPEPEESKIRALIYELKSFTNVHIKPNLKRLGGF